ncbi:MAG: hypothetical protein WB820_05475, partial [Rhodoplanes sp.]
LKVMKCSTNLYKILSDLYKNFRDEMKLRIPFTASEFPSNAITPFSNLRATIESTSAAAVQFITEGTFVRQPAPPPNVGEQVAVNVTAEGWRVQ